MKATPCKVGDLIETLPQVGVAPGRIVAPSLDDKGRRRRGYWDVDLQLDGGAHRCQVRRIDFVVVRASPEEEDIAGARAQAKRKGVARG